MFARGCLFGLIFSVLIWAILIGLVVAVSKSWGQEVINPKLLPPEGLVIVVPRILFPPEKEVD